MLKDIWDFITDYFVLFVFVLILLGYYGWESSDRHTRCEKAFPDSTYVEHERCVKHLKDGGELWELEKTDEPQ